MKSFIAYQVLLIIMRQGRGSEATGAVFFLRQKSLIPDCIQGAIINLFCRYVCVRVCDTKFVVFTDCDSCTRPISVNPVNMKAGENGLTCGTCFFVCRLEVVVFAGLLRLSWCVLGGVDFFVFFPTFCFFECARPAASVRPPCLIYLSITCVYYHECQRPPAQNA